MTKQQLESLAPIMLVLGLLSSLLFFVGGSIGGGLIMLSGGMLLGVEAWQCREARKTRNSSK